MSRGTAWTRALEAAAYFSPTAANQPKLVFSRWDYCIAQPPPARPAQHSTQHPSTQTPKHPRAPPPKRTDEGGKGVDDKRGAQHDEQVRLREVGGGAAEEALRQVLPEEDDVRLHQAIAALWG